MKVTTAMSVLDKNNSLVNRHNNPASPSATPCRPGCHEIAATHFASLGTFSGYLTRFQGYSVNKSREDTAREDTSRRRSRRGSQDTRTVLISNRLCLSRWRPKA